MVLENGTAWWTGRKVGGRCRREPPIKQKIWEQGDTLTILKRTQGQKVMYAPHSTKDSQLVRHAQDPEIVGLPSLRQSRRSVLYLPTAEDPGTVGHATHPADEVRRVSQTPVLQRTQGQQWARLGKVNFLIPKVALQPFSLERIVSCHFFHKVRTNIGFSLCVCVCVLRLEGEKSTGRKKNHATSNSPSVGNKSATYRSLFP